jgi:PAS domain S-box-containing protein
MLRSIEVSDSENAENSIERLCLSRAKDDLIPPDDQTLFFRQIVDLSPVLLHTARPDGYLDFFNQTWLNFAGVPLKSLLGWGWTCCIHPDDVDAFVQTMRESFAEGKPFEDTSRVRRADGVYRWMLHLRVPIFDSAGNLIRWNGSSIDIDDRKKAEEQLIKDAQESQRSEFYLAEAQRLGHIGSWVFDPASGFEHWSHELFQIHGLDPLNGPPNSEQYLALVHPEDRDFMASMMKRMLSDNSAFDVTKRIVRAGGDVRYVRCVGTAISNDAASRRIGVGIDVTENETLTQELKRREAYLAEAQRLSQTGSFGWKPSGEEFVCSEETYRILEYEPAEKLTLDKIIERTHPEDRTLVRETAERAALTGGAIDFTHRLLFADGRVKHLHVLAKPLLTTCNELEFAGAVTDITERKTAEEKIRRNERELQTLIDVMPAYVGTALPDGTADYLSQRWLDYFGQTREGALGWGWAGVVHPDDVDRVSANWHAGLASGEPVEQELRCRRADGVYRWFLNRNLPLRDDEGKIVKWYGILFDVNSLKETEHALQMREHELVGMIETIPSMLWSTSPTGKSTHVSRRILDYCGVPLEELAKRLWERITHPEDREETVESFAKAISSGEPYSAIHRLRRADGEYRWHHSTAEPLRDPSGKIIQWYGLSIDIDDRKRVEDHLRDTSIKLAKASRLAAVAELAASIAHELSQPLTSIIANAQAARRWLIATPPKVTEVNASIERTIRAARAADETMQHIRALFKQESLDKKDVNILDILHEVVRVVQEDPTKRDLPIEYCIEQSLPLVRVDQIQLQQVFINLIVNAIEAMEGQEVAPLVVLRVTTDSNGMLIQVIDNGPGVDFPDQIFDAFMTTKANGMGIGLAVSRSIVEAHGGRLWAENGPNGGARLNVTLPLPPMSGEPSRANESEGSRI